MVGLEIDDQNLVIRHHQAVDLPGNQRRPPVGPLQPADDGDLGAAAGRKYRRKASVNNQGQRIFRELLALVVGPAAIGVTREIRERGFASA